MSGETLQQMVATPLEIQAGGKTYKLSQLTLGQFADLEAWAKEQPFAELAGKVAAITDDKLRDGMRPRLMDDAVAASSDPERLAGYMDSVAGISRQFEMSIRANHPDVTAEEIDSVLSLAGMIQVRLWLDSLTGEVTDEAGNR